MNINDTIEARGTHLRQQVKSLREAGGVSQRQAAELSHLKPSVVCRFEVEEGASPTLRTVLRLIEAVAPRMTLAIVPIEDYSQKSEQDG